jgi:ribosomal protein S13
LHQNYVFNGKLLDLEETLLFNLIKSYGFKYTSLRLIEERIENTSYILLKDLNKNECEHFINIIYEIIPYRTTLFKRKSFNIFMTDTITIYRGWRHFKGLPVRGQRT